MKLSAKGVIAGLLVGGIVSLAIGYLNAQVLAHGGADLGWGVRVGTGTALGIAVLFIVSALSGNRDVRFASPEADRQAKAFAAVAGGGVVYVFRDAFVGKLVGIDLLVDGHAAAQTRGKTFVRLELTPGAHTLASVTPGVENLVQLPVDVAAGAVLYVEQGIRMGAVTSGPTLTPRDAAEGQKRIAKCRLLAPPAPGVT